VSLSSSNAPSIYSGKAIDAEQKPGPIIEIPVPQKGYTRSKVFDV